LRAETAPLLVLDELGQEIADDRWLLEFLNARYNSGLPTISTSGLARPELEKRYGAGAVRRLVEPTGQFLDLFDACGSRAGE
jgi:DNA replication protein DnaC